VSEKIKALVVTQDGGKIEQLRTAFEALPGFEVKAVKRRVRGGSK